MATHRSKGIRKEILYSDEQWKEIEKKAGESDLKTTEFIRKISLEGYVVNYDLSSIRELTTSINRVGTNINQLVKNTNENRVVYKNQLDQVIGYQKEIWDLIYNLLEKYEE